MIRRRPTQEFLRLGNTGRIHRHFAGRQSVGDRQHPVAHRRPVAVTLGDIVQRRPHGLLQARTLRRVGDAIDFEIEDVVPFGVESGEPVKMTGIFHPVGSELTVSRATRSKIDAFGIQYEGNSGFSTSEFSWTA